MFFDRREAGERLVERLLSFAGKDVIVLAIPRGGVLVGDEVAKHLGATLDVVIPRKIGAPGNPELAIGAVVDKDKVILNEELVEALRVPDEYIIEEVEKELKEITRRREKYSGKKEPLNLKDKTVIIVDDGLATGYTAIAAIRAIKKDEPKKIILAVPVAPTETYERLKEEVDEIICLNTPSLFFAVGQFYTDFSQVSDEDVVAILSKYS